LEASAVPHQVNGSRASSPPSCVLFDRDGTLIRDVPYNGDPSKVEPLRGARAAVDRLRAAEIRVGVVTNQSALGRGLITEQQMLAVNGHVEELLGPFDVWAICPHDPADGCGCRKPAPRLIVEACSVLAVDPSHAVVIGDIASDVEAAEAAGARGVLVPNAQTDPREIRSAACVYSSLGDAIEAVLGASG
jgi:histidinol-phosphate phosphatase family protein